MYLLDTNTCIRYLNDLSSPVARKLQATRRSEVCLCSVVKAELYFGAYNSRRRERNLAVLAEFFNEFVSLPFDDAAAHEYGRIRADLQAQGIPIGPNDLLIAAIALAHNMILVSANLREFGRVAGLRYESWEEEAQS